MTVTEIGICFKTSLCWLCSQIFIDTGITSATNCVTSDMQQAEKSGSDRVSGTCILNQGLGEV